MSDTPSEPDAPPMNPFAPLGDARPKHETKAERLLAERKRAQGYDPQYRTAKPQQVIIARNATPTVPRMLDDAYQTVSQQLYQFRVNAHIEQFDSATANAFSKVVGCLVTLQEAEVRNRAALQLGELSQDEIDALAAEARAILTKQGV